MRRVRTVEVIWAFELRWVGVLGAALSSLTALAGCGTTEPTPPIKESSKPSPSATAPAGHVEWVKLPMGVSAPDFVRAEASRAEHEKKKLLIYVGASWCEPCQRFHKAAEAGELDNAFGDLRFIDLDNDANEAEIEALDCKSKLIPLFAVPNSEGKCADRRVEGGIKGDGAVAYISPKLRAMVDR